MVSLVAVRMYGNLNKTFTGEQKLSGWETKDIQATVNWRIRWALYRWD